MRERERSRERERETGRGWVPKGERYLLLQQLRGVAQAHGLGGVGGGFVPVLAVEPAGEIPGGAGGLEGAEVLGVADVLLVVVVLEVGGGPALLRRAAAVGLVAPRHAVGDVELEPLEDLREEEGGGVEGGARGGARAVADRAMCVADLQRLETRCDDSG